MMRGLTVLLVLLQFLVLAYMAGHREYIVRKGETVYLRTAPVDPRDIFRGDFVRLNYEISIVRAPQLELEESSKKRGRRVYATLTQMANELYGLDRLTDVEPENGLFIRGRIANDYPSSRVDVRYGIEQLFVEQGKGLDMEERRGTRGTFQMPMEVSVALSTTGIAVIKGYRWSRLGIQLEVSPRPLQRTATSNLEDAEGPLSPKLKLTLRNVSEEPLALVNPGDNCGFDIIPDSRTADREYKSAYQGCAEVRPNDGDVVELAPEQEFIVELDLSEPRWHVVQNGIIDEIGRFTQSWWERFRILYRRPDPSSLVGLRAEGRVWDGYLLSPAFSVTGQVD